MTINPELIGLIVAIVLALNTFLFGLYKALEFIKDKTVSQADNAIYDWVGKALSFLQKVIEIIGPVTAVKKVEEKK